MKRHEIYDVYTDVPQHSIPIRESKDLFLPNTDTEGNTPRTILALGRPGIGKTVLAEKIMFDWAKEIDFYQGKIAFLFKLRWFGLDELKDLNLKTFLRLGTLLNEDEFESVYEEILADPKKALFIFDGLDEAGGNVSEFQNLLDRSRLLPNDPKVVMPAILIFIKIAFGYLLGGSTIFVTSRPTAIDFFTKLPFDRTVEIIGFTLDKIKEYVDKFCTNNNQTDLQPKIWSHISSWSEVRNLCYIPVNCFIVCVALSHCLNNPSNDNILPTTLTELYTKALVYFSKHHDRNKNNERNDVTIKKLQHLAFYGMENDQLVFNKQRVNEQMKEFGFLNCLSEPIFPLQAQFCFIHLTVQEFLAARHIVEAKDPKNIKKFISSHFEIGKWHLVLQFLAGLLGTRMKFDHILDITKHLTNYMDKDTAACWLRPGTMLVMKCLREVNNEDIVKNLPLNDITQIRCDMECPYIYVVSPSDWATVVLVCKRLNCLADLHLQGRIKPDSLQEVTKLLNVRCTRNLSFSHCKLDDYGITLVFHALMKAKCKLRHEHFKFTSLNVIHNCFGDVGVSCISEFLKNAHGSSLKELDLSLNTKITSDGISTLCEGLSEIVGRRLTKLCLDGCSAIGNVGVRTLCKTLVEKQFELTELDLSQCSLTSECMEALCEVLSNEHCKVINLHLRSNSIGDEGVRMLSGGLMREHCKLTVLDLSRCGFTDKGMGPLGAALGDEHCGLTNLRLSSNAIGDEGVRMLSGGLMREHCKLTVLDLSRCGFTDKGMGPLGAALGDEHCGLTNLRLHSNAIGDEGVRMLSGGLMREHCKLTVLDLSTCGFTDKGMGPLCAALGDEHCGLTNLSLSSNAIGDEGVRMLSGVLMKEHCKVTVLNLVRCRLTEECMDCLCTAIEHCRSTNLNLGYNAIGDEGASKLFGVLSKEQCKLTVLYLHFCSLTDECLPSLCRALGNNHCSLTQLNVNMNYFTDKHLELLSDTLKHKHCRLKGLRISKGNMTEKGCQLLKDTEESEHCKARGFQMIILSNMQ